MKKPGALTPEGQDKRGSSEAPRRPNETILPVRRNELATRTRYLGARSQHEREKVRRMIEAATIAIALSCGGILGTLAVKAYSRTDEWLVRVPSVGSMYQKIKRRGTKSPAPDHGVTMFLKILPN